MFIRTYSILAVLKYTFQIDYNSYLDTNYHDFMYSPWKKALSCLHQFRAEHFAFASSKSTTYESEFKIYPKYWQKMFYNF